MDKDMSLQEFHNMLRPITADKGIPLIGGFELTNRCNLSCSMCYVKYKGAGSTYIKGELSTKQWIRLGEEAVENGALSVYLTGGEPLIRDDFREIYKVYCRLGFRVNLFSNGTLITEEFAKWLSQFPPATVDVTLYGASPNTYLQLCGQKSAFDSTINGIEFLLKHNINTRIKTTIVKANIYEYQKIKSIAEGYGLEFLPGSLIHGNRTYGIQDIGKVRLEPKEIIDLERSYTDKFDKESLDIENLRKKYLDIPAMACSACKNSFFINWRGEMVPCALFETISAKPLVTGYINAWNELREKIKDIPANNECMICKLRAFCPVCPPRLYLETGKFDGLSDYVCQLAALKEKLCIEYTG